MVWKLNSQWKAMVHREGDAIPGIVNMIAVRLGLFEGNDFRKNRRPLAAEMRSILLEPQRRQQPLHADPCPPLRSNEVAADGMEMHARVTNWLQWLESRICSSDATMGDQQGRQFAVSIFLRM